MHLLFAYMHVGELRLLKSKPPRRGRVAPEERGCSEVGRSEAAAAGGSVLVALICNTLEELSAEPLVSE